MLHCLNLTVFPLNSLTLAFLWRRFWMEGFADSKKEFSDFHVFVNKFQANVAPSLFQSRCAKIVACGFMIVVCCTKNDSKGKCLNWFYFRDLFAGQTRIPNRNRVFQSWPHFLLVYIIKLQGCKIKKMSFFSKSKLSGGLFHRWKMYFFPILDHYSQLIQGKLSQ